MQRAIQFWIHSYQSDPVAFGFELVSFIVTVMASMMLAINAQNPDMTIVYPFFFVGALSQCYAALRRGAAWVMLLTAYFTFINIFGFIVAIGWWIP